MQMITVFCFAILLASAYPAEAATKSLMTGVIAINGSGYQSQVTLPAGVGQLYTITTPQPAGTYYNVRIQISETLGHVGFYCNPSWGGQPSQNNYVAQPGNAVWGTADAVTDDLTIPANDALYLPTNTTSTPSILSGLNSSTSSYRPAFNCTMINPSSSVAAIASLNVTFDANNRTLSASEVGAITNIYTSCCTASGSCTAWKQKTQQLGDPLYTNFCQFQGQYCTSTGHLQKLDLTSYGLQCAFPVTSLQQFGSLETLVLSSNPNLTGTLDQLAGAMTSLTGLRRLELVEVSGIKGPLATSNASLCQLIQNGLQYLDLTDVKLTGSLPSCLLASPGLLSQVALTGNNLTGPIPNTIPSNSSLFALLLDSNNLTGSIPLTLTNAEHLSVLQLNQNQLSGSIPSAFGGDTDLLNRVLLNNNSLTGTLPSGLATSQSATYLDVSYNRLTALPSEWTQGFSQASNSSYSLLYLQNNNIQSLFPAAVAQFPVLYVLSANNNSLSGTLPNGTAIFPQTRVLNLAYNQLNGSIPASFNTSGPLNGNLANIAISAGTVLQKTLNLAHNDLSGSVPSYLASNKLSATTRNGISLLGNNLTADCGNSSYTYLDICDSLRNSSNSPYVSPSPSNSPSPSPSPVLTTSPAGPAASSPAATTAASPAATPAAAGLSPAVGSPANVSTDSGDNSRSASSSGISGGAIFGIVVGVLAALVVAAAGITYFVKRQNNNKRTLLRMQSSGGFSRFSDFS